MAYTRVWDDTTPTGSEQAKTIDDLIRNLKVDIQERLNTIFNMTDANFVADPIQPQLINIPNAAEVPTVPQQCIDDWTASPTANQSNLILTRPAGKFFCPRSGKVIGVGLWNLSTPATSGSCTLSVFKTQVNLTTGAQTEVDLSTGVSINDGIPVFNNNVPIAGVTFNAGDWLYLKVTNVLFAPTPCNIRAALLVEFDG